MKWWLFLVNVCIIQTWLNNERLLTFIWLFNIVYVIFIALKKAQTGSCLLVLSSPDTEASIHTQREKEFMDLIRRKKIAIVVFRQTPMISSSNTNT